MHLRRLADFPFVVVRLRCDACQRAGSYRLARLAAKFGAEILLDDLLIRLSSDCPWRDEPRGTCGVRFADLYRLPVPAAIPNFQPDYNVCPTDPADVVVPNEGGRDRALMRWGLVPYWWGKPLKELRLATSLHRHVMMIFRCSQSPPLNMFGHQLDDPNRREPVDG